MSTQGIKAGRAYVELGANDSQLQRALNRASTKMKDFGMSIGMIGKDVAIAGAVAGAPLAVSSVVFKDFEKEMARVRALTGATGDQYDQLAAKARKLGEDTEHQARQAAQGMSYFALAGFSTQEILDVIGPTLNLASTGMIEIKDAADISAKVMAGMGIEAKDSGYAVDVLAKAMTTANTDLAMLGDAFRYVGAAAKGAGFQFEEVTAAIQILSNAGIQGSMAGTTLRMAMIRLANPSMEGSRILDKLGVSAADAKGNAKPLADVLDEINAATKGMGSIEKFGIVAEIFNARAATGMMALMDKGGDKLRQFTQRLRESGGTASRIAGTQINTIWGALKILESTIESVGISIGNVLMPAIRVGIEHLNQFVLVVKDWVKTNPDLIMLIGATSAGLLTLGAAFIGVGLAATVLGTALAGIGTLLGIVSGAIAAIVSPVGLATIAVAGITAAVLHFTGAGAVALDWISEKFNTLREHVFKVWKGMSDAMKAGNLQLAVKVTWAGIKDIFFTYTGDIQRFWINSVAVVLRTWHTAVAEIMKAWASIKGIATIAMVRINIAWEGMSKRFSSFVESMSKIWDKFSSRFVMVWDKAARGWAKITAPLLKAMNTMGDQAAGAALAEIQQAQQEALDERTDAERWAAEDAAAERAAIEKDLQDKLAGIEADRLRDLAGIDAAAEGAKAELEEALREAAAAAADAAKAGVNNELPNIRGGAIADDVDIPGVGSKGSTFGSFSAAALARLTSPEQKTHERLDKANKLLAEIVKAVRGNVLAFN